jgi:hypothetical protein
VRSSDLPAWREESNNRIGVCHLSMTRDSKSEPKNEGRRSELRLAMGLLSLDDQVAFVGVV